MSNEKNIAQVESPTGADADAPMTLAQMQAQLQALQEAHAATLAELAVTKAAVAPKPDAVPTLRSVAHVARGERNMRYVDGRFVRKDGANAQAVALERTWFAIGVSDGSAIAYEIRDVHMGALRDALIAHLAEA